MLKRLSRKRKKKEKLSKKARERYQNLSDEEKYEKC